jgi:hypothetical protein
MHIDQFLKPGSQYRIVAIGAALLAAVILSTLYALLTSPPTSIEALGSTGGIFDVPLALMITLASFLVFSGLWKINPETKPGAWAVRCVIAILVVLNLLVWGMAVWLR